jgi:hypothetical protein
MGKKKFLGWEAVSKKLRELAETQEGRIALNKGQKKSLMVISKNILNNGMIIADEVGMGKTRIAVSLAKAVTECGGRVAVLIPPGLGYQWQGEFREMKVPNIDSPVRSLHGFIHGDNHFLEKDIVIISHLFASNWKLGKKSRIDRFGILPEIYAALRKKETDSYPNYFYVWNEKYGLGSDSLRALAENIVEKTNKKKSHPARKILEDISNLPWNESFYKGENYSANEYLRPYLQKAIGLVLGCFDLVLIDEAHKNRVEGSGLNELLDVILCLNKNSRTFSLTATPLELTSDNWNLSLKRIGVKEDFSNVISEFSNSLEEIRKVWKTQEKAKEVFFRASKKFEKTLRPYIIRRDKREEEDIIIFRNKSGLNHYEYREYEKKVVIDPTDLEFSKEWKVAICAAESLSYVADNDKDSIAKRSRLTIANGHSLGKWIESFDSEAESDEDIKFFIENGEKGNSEDAERSLKKNQRKNYWQEKLISALRAKSNNLFYHPNILAAAKFIEDNYSLKKRKILVFGRFTRPLKALCELLNAREIVRRVQNSEFWPQFKLNKEEELAVSIAINQMKSDISIEEVRTYLKKGESKMEYARKKFRSNFFQKLQNEFELDPIEKDSLFYSIFAQLKKDSEKEDANISEGDHLFHSITRACYELIQGSDFVGTKEKEYGLLDSFKELISSCLDLDIFGEEEENVDDDAIEDYILRLKHILKEEYSVHSGRYAKLLNGNTSHPSRRLIQMAFNREQSFPYILVSQSQVGREGLNLHKACHSVMMLHPEWNPAVSEQQIGRVDRINGLWSKLLIKYQPSENGCPKIEVIPVIFKHTYDEQNWSVLMERWSNLKAHLQGIIIPENLATNEEERILIREINANAPDFRPT